MKIPIHPIHSIQSLFKAYLTPSLEEEIEQCILLKQRSLIHAQREVLLITNHMVQIEEELELLHLWQQSLEQNEETLLDLSYDYRSIGKRNFTREE